MCNVFLDCFDRFCVKNSVVCYDRVFKPVCDRLYTHTMAENRIACIIVAQLLFALGVSFFVGMQVQDIVPHDWNATAWSEFSEHTMKTFDISGTGHRILLLLTLHTLHLYCYMPMLHVTKILYGYWLGAGTGWIVCVVWEMFLFGLFLKVLRRETRTAVQDYVTNVRQQKRLFFQISVVCISSLPLQTKTLLVKYSDITDLEYLCSNFGPTLLLTLKNVVCGALLADAPTPKNIAIISFIVAFTLVLPTLSTILVSSQTIFVLLKKQQHVDDAAVCGNSLTPHTHQSPQTQTLAQTTDSTHSDMVCSTTKTVACQHKENIPCLIKKPLLKETKVQF